MIRSLEDLRTDSARSEAQIDRDAGPRVALVSTLALCTTATSTSSARRANARTSWWCRPSSTRCASAPPTTPRPIPGRPSPTRACSVSWASTSSSRRRRRSSSRGNGDDPRLGGRCGSPLRGACAPLLLRRGADRRGEALPPRSTRRGRLRGARSAAHLPRAPHGARPRLRHRRRDGSDGAHRRRAAVSSRVALLDDADRRAAAALPRALEAAASNADLGVDACIAAAQSALMGEQRITLEYLSVVDPRRSCRSTTGTAGARSRSSPPRSAVTASSTTPRSRCAEGPRAAGDSGAAEDDE